MDGNVFYNSERAFDITVTSDNANIYSSSGDGLRSTQFLLMDDDQPSGVLKIVNGAVVEYDVTWSEIRAAYPNTSFGAATINGTFYGIVSMDNIDPGVSFANYANPYSPSKSLILLS